MNHSFNPSILDSLKCEKCMLSELMHSDKATCEACPAIGPVNIMKLHNGRVMAVCQKCEDESKKIIADRLKETLDKREQIDATVEYNTDFFNLESVSINELKTAIFDSDAANKPYMFAEQLMERFNTYKQKLFNLSAEIAEANNRQRAVQVELNQISNLITAEEREKLRIKDINYKPQPIKSTKPKAISGPKKKFNKAELKDVSEQFKIPEFLLQQYCIQRNITALEAAKLIKEKLGQANN